ncbi:MAG: PfkB family carbohydrate kinase [Chloroflexales bacterium]|nr:PfkB family carbohydrate kinase [Chloroflexales bacterium]
MQPNYLMLGHITSDLLPDGSTIPGGTALYAARTAQRLGMHPAIVSATATLPIDWPNDVPVASVVGSNAPIFENRYTPNGRIQFLHGDAPPLVIADVPSAWRTAQIVHLGPILVETPLDIVAHFPNALIGMTPQGMMRQWQPPFPCQIQYTPFLPEPTLLARINILVMSIEDVHGDQSVAEHYAQHCRIVALTRGANGADIYLDGIPHHINAYPAIERDPTGAGDVFAAALMVRYAETRNAIDAAQFAAVVAAASVEGLGISTIPDRPTIEARLGNYLA